MLQGAAFQGPCMLVHPLESIQEVQMQAATGVGAAWDADERVVWSGTEVPYLVTLNTVRARCIGPCSWVLPARLRLLAHGLAPCRRRKFPTASCAASACRDTCAWLCGASEQSRRRDSWR